MPTPNSRNSLAKRLAHPAVLVSLLSFGALMGYVGYATHSVLTNSNFEATAQSTTFKVGTVAAALLTTHHLPPVVTLGTGFQQSLYGPARNDKAARRMTTQLQRCLNASTQSVSLSIVRGTPPGEDSKGFEDNAIEAQTSAAQRFTYSQTGTAPGESRTEDYSRVGFGSVERLAATTDSGPVLGDLACSPIDQAPTVYPFASIEALTAGAQSTTPVHDANGQTWAVRKEGNLLVAKAVFDSNADMDRVRMGVETDAREHNLLPASRSYLALAKESLPLQIVRSQEFRYQNGTTKNIIADTRVKTKVPTLSMLITLPTTPGPAHQSREADATGVR